MSSLYTNFQDLTRAIRVALNKKADKSYVDDNLTTIDTALDTKVDKEIGKGLSSNDFTNTLKNKLDGIATGAEVNVQSDWSVSDSTSDAYIQNKPTNVSSFTNDANYTTKTYVDDELDDKVDKETGKGLSTNDFTDTLKTKLDNIEAGAEVNVQADWSQTTTTADDYIKNKPTNVSAFTNDAEYTTKTYVDGELDDKVDKVSGKGLSTNDFTDTLKTKLDNIEAGAEVNVQADWSQTTTTADDYIKNKPTNVSAFTNDANYATETYVDTGLGGKVDKVTGKGLSTNDFTDALQTKLNGIAEGAEVNVQADWSQSTTTADDYIKNKPTNVSAFTNDSGYITKAVNDLTYYYTTSNTYTKTEVNTLIGNITKVTIQIVEELPQDPSPNVIYFVPKSTTGTNNGYDEYIYVNNNWELIGDTEVDLSDYATITYVDTGLGGKVDKVTGKQLSTNDFTDTLKTKLDNIEAGAEVNVQSDWSQTTTTADDYIKNKPTNVSAFTNDANYTSKTYVDGELDDKVDKVEGKQLSTEDFTSAFKTKLEGIATGAEVNVQSDWNQTTTTADDYIKNKPTKVSDFTNDSNFTTKTYVDGELDDKVDKVSGKGLSTNDFTDALQTKLNGIAEVPRTRSPHRCGIPAAVGCR